MWWLHREIRKAYTPSGKVLQNPQPLSYRMAKPTANLLRGSPPDRPGAVPWCEEASGQTVARRQLHPKGLGRLTAGTLSSLRLETRNKTRSHLPLPQLGFCLTRAHRRTKLSVF